MPGAILLEGGAEFGGKMAEPDRRALELAGGPGAAVRILPTAAAPDENHRRAAGNGRRWFRGLGARDVSAVLLLNRENAEQPEIAAALRQARLIYLLGGFTHYLAQTLIGSLAWEAVLAAYQEGAVVAGSSAGAMVLCQYYYDPSSGIVHAGLGLVPTACVIPHHNTFGRAWAATIRERAPNAVLAGIDERTGMLTAGGSGAWTVYGGGGVTLYRPGSPALSFHPGETFRL